MPHARQVLARGLPHAADLSPTVETMGKRAHGHLLDYLTGNTTSALQATAKGTALGRNDVHFHMSPHAGQTQPTVQQPYW